MKRKTRRGFGAAALLPPLLVLAVVLLGGCTPPPTPYQPLTEDYGYEETRLQPNVYRVSFKANAYTAETRVLDYLYLRSAELTRQAGFTHFVISQDFGKSQSAGRPAPRMSVGLGFFSGTRNTFWGAGAHVPAAPADYEGGVLYHLGVFIIRMLTPEQAAKEPEAMEVGFLLKSIHEKMARAAPAGS